MLMRARLPLLAILYELELAVYSGNTEYHLIAKPRIHIFQTASQPRNHVGCKGRNGGRILIIVGVFMPI